MKARADNNRHRTSSPSPSFARLVAEWTDLECGCSHASTGSWIIRLDCDDHMAMLPDPEGTRKNVRHYKAGEYGPWRPS